jgi:excisionase family DNA binding protein
LIADIIADVDEKSREVILTIHWQGGQHSQLRIRKPRAGEHGRRTSAEALAVMRSMSCRWSDQDIAASLNRMGMRTGQGMTWNAQRVSTVRREHGIHAYRSAEKSGEWLTMSEAAKLLCVSHHVIRRLIRERVLNAGQVVPGAPYQIRADDLHSEAVAAALARTYRPCRVVSDDQFSMFISTSEGGAQ